MIIYIYDLKFKNKKEFNRQKRKFYYNLNKLPIDKKNWFNRSVILVPDNKENIFDEFFKTYKKTEKNLLVYKIFTSNIEEIE
ncbi:MAG: hypothetical protein QXF35_01685 [Candidatus Bilamarchaeaceae archaeon]